MQNPGTEHICLLKEIPGHSGIQHWFCCEQAFFTDLHFRASTIRWKHTLKTGGRSSPISLSIFSFPKEKAKQKLSRSWGVQPCSEARCCPCCLAITCFEEHGFWLTVFSALCQPGCATANCACAIFGRPSCKWEMAGRCLCQDPLGCLSRQRCKQHSSVSRTLLLSLLHRPKSDLCPMLCQMQTTDTKSCLANKVHFKWTSLEM